MVKIKRLFGSTSQDSSAQALKANTKIRGTFESSLVDAERPTLRHILEAQVYGPLAFRFRLKYAPESAH